MRGGVASCSVFRKMGGVDPRLGLDTGSPHRGRRLSTVTEESLRSIPTLLRAQGQR